MVHVKNEGVVLERTTLAFEKQAVLNPAVIERDGTTHLFYRAVDEQLISRIGYAYSADGQTWNRSDHPVLVPEHAYEIRGMEDPRITFLGGIYYLMYTAFDGTNARIAYATSTDLVHFEKQGVLSAEISYADAEVLFHTAHLGEEYSAFCRYCQQVFSPNMLLWEKDACLFPEKINGRFHMLHRVMPSIQVVAFDDFSQLKEAYWREHLAHLGEHTVLESEHWFESAYIGGGCPPIKVNEGWLMIYHAVEKTPKGKIYHAAVALLDLEHPTRVIGRLREPLFSPIEPWERHGDVPNVVFPTGAVVRDGRLWIYYGAADRLIAAKSVDLKELIGSLLEA